MMAAMYAAGILIGLIVAACLALVPFFVVLGGGGYILNTIPFGRRLLLAILRDFSDFPSASCGQGRHRRRGRICQEMHRPIRQCEISPARMKTPKMQTVALILNLAGAKPRSTRRTTRQI
jgi:hypothetical protein